MRTWWKNNGFIRAAVGVIDQFPGDQIDELTILGRSSLLWTLGCHTFESLMARTLCLSAIRNTSEATTQNFLPNTPLLTQLSFLIRCFQKTWSVVFGTLDPFLMTEFSSIQLKVVWFLDWTQSRQSFRMATESGDFSLPGLLDVVNNINGVWSLISAVMVLWYGFFKKLFPAQLLIFISLLFF